MDHLDCTLVNYLNLHSSICPIRYLFWLSVNDDGYDCTAQGSSPHKCGKKNCCSAFNVVVAAFLLDIFVFLFSSYAPKVHPYRWTFLEGHLSHPSTCLTDIHPIREARVEQDIISTSTLRRVRREKPTVEGGSCPPWPTKKKNPLVYH